MFCQCSFLFLEPVGIVERNSAKLCHMLGSEPDLKIVVQNLGFPPSSVRFVGELGV